MLQGGGVSGERRRWCEASCVFNSAQLPTCVSYHVSSYVQLDISQDIYIGTTHNPHHTHLSFAAVFMQDFKLRKFGLFAIYDSGAPPGKENYVTVVSIHGYLWHSGEYCRARADVLYSFSIQVDLFQSYLLLRSTVSALFFSIGETIKGQSLLAKTR